MTGGGTLEFCAARPQHGRSLASASGGAEAMENTKHAAGGQTSAPIFGDTLRELRRAAGLTQAELAERANLSPRGLSDLERGVNRRPRRETLLALADAFNLSDEERERFFAAARRRTQP